MRLCVAGLVVVALAGCSQTPSRHPDPGRPHRHRTTDPRHQQAVAPAIPPRWPAMTPSNNRRAQPTVWGPDTVVMYGIGGLAVGIGAIVWVSVHLGRPDAGLWDILFGVLDGNIVWPWASTGVAGIIVLIGVVAMVAARHILGHRGRHTTRVDQSSRYLMWTLQLDSSMMSGSSTHLEAPQVRQAGSNPQPTLGSCYAPPPISSCGCQRLACPGRGRETSRRKALLVDWFPHPCLDIIRRNSRVGLQT